MISLGFKRKDLGDGYYGCSPCCPSDDPKKKEEYENEEVHPEFDIRGKHADALGFDDLKVGDRITVTIELEVKGKRDDSRTVDGKVQRDMSMTMKILAADDYEVEDSEEGDQSEGEDNSESEGSVMAAALRNLGGESAD